MPVIFGILFRHALTAAGVYLVTKGYADEQTAEMITGAVGTLFGFGFSVLNKKRSGAI